MEPWGPRMAANSTCPMAHGGLLGRGQVVEAEDVEVVAALLVEVDVAAEVEGWVLFEEGLDGWGQGGAVAH